MLLMVLFGIFKYWKTLNGKNTQMLLMAEQGKWACLCWVVSELFLHRFRFMDLQGFLGLVRRLL